MCVACGFVYDEEIGDVQSGLAPGTRWEDVPADWNCPDCGMSKSEFQMTEM